MAYRNTEFDNLNKLAGCIMWLVIFAACLFLVTHSSICHAIAQNLLGAASDFFWNLRARV